MVFFLAIIVSPITLIIPFLFITFNGVGVIPNCQGIIFPISFFFKILLFLICAGDFSSLSKVEAEWSTVFTLGWLWFLGPKLFRLRFLGIKSLGLDLYWGGIKRVVAPGEMDIQISDHSAGFEAHYGLCVNCFLYYLFKVHGIPVLLLHLYLNERLESFSEITDYGKFIGGADTIKLC